MSKYKIAKWTTVPIIEDLTSRCSRIVAVNDQHININQAILEHNYQYNPQQNGTSSINLYNYPHSTIGMIVSVFEGVRNFLGVLITENRILTSASAVYDRSKGKQTSKVELFFGLDKKRCQNRYVVKNYFYPKQYTSNVINFQEYNFAVLELQCPDGDTGRGYLGISIEWLKDETDLVLFGQNKYNQLFQFKTQLCAYDNPTYAKFKDEFQNNKLLGGPILIRRKNNYYVRGINSNFSEGIILGKEFKRHINQWVHFQNYQLTLYQTGIEAQELSSIVKEDFTSELTALNLSENDIGIQGIEALQQGCFYSLQDLYLWGNNIEDQGLEILVKMNLPSLRMLGLGNNGLTVNSIQILKKGKWPRLNTLDLRFNNLKQKSITNNAAIINKLRSIFPLCDIQI